MYNTIRAVKHAITHSHLSDLTFKGAFYMAPLLKLEFPIKIEALTSEEYPYLSLGLPISCDSLVSLKNVCFKSLFLFNYQT